MSQIDTKPDWRGDTRRRWFLVLGAAILAACLAWGCYWFFYSRYFETTNDAYVGGDIVAITARESGTVLALYADNTQAVKRGELLVALDPASVNVAMQAAEANLAAKVRGVRGAFAKADSWRAQLASARIALARAQTDYQRRQSAGDAVSGEDLAHARDAVQSAGTAVNAAEAALQESLAGVEGTTIADNPDVRSAEAQLRNAAIGLGHMRIVAPVDGVIAQRNVEVGQQIAAGTPLMAVVPLDDAWIDANFKEGQLTRLRVGQPVTVETDMYGGSVVYHGKVEGLGAGSGSAFALLPPQNASGNWIKIVQRVPVRIALDPRELAAHPLRIGLSVDVRVDVRDDSGPLVSAVKGPQTMHGVPGDEDAETEALIARIVAANSGEAK